MINLPPRTYCRIQDPIIRKKDNTPELTPFNQVKNKFGEFEIRTFDAYPDPFPLYPGEKLIGKIEKLLIVAPNQSLRLKAIRDFSDGKKKF